MQVKHNKLNLQVQVRVRMKSLAVVTFSLLKGHMSSQVIIWVRQNKSQSRTHHASLEIVLGRRGIL